MIGLILPCNLKYAPYAQYYIDALKNANTEYEILSWNKKKMEENCDHVFNYYANDSERAKILWGHFRFSLFVKRLVAKKKYSHLVVFTAAPMFFLTSLLSKKYNQRFIADIRDSSPFIKKFPRWFEKITSKAKEVVVSSPNFSEWIPRETILCHNCSIEMLREHRDDEIIGEVKTPVKIACAGSMIEGEANIRFLDAAKNEQLFAHCYIGNDSNARQKIIDHVAAEKYTNVTFRGTYKKEEIVSIYRETADFVNIIRKKSRINADALPNKLYDAVVSGKPVIVLDHNTAIVKLVEKYNLGLVVTQDELDDAEEKLLPRMKEFSYSDYASGRVEFVDYVLSEQIKFNDIIKELR